jgi:hypothetical protein
MKRIFYVLFFLAINMLISAKPIQADDAGSSNLGLKEQKLFKDECLLVARNCPSPDYKLQERINRLRDEIDRGTAVYTPEELGILRRKLEDARATQEFFLHEAPSLPY